MICESSSLNKYIDKSSNIFFICGPEIILKNNSLDQINNFLKSEGFSEKKIVSNEDYSDINKIIYENASGSLFGSKIIIEINHIKGKMPKEIRDIFEIKDIQKFDNIAIIIKSSIEKINKRSNWVKKIDKFSLIIECKKLKSFEEKIWIKNQLNFMTSKDAEDYSIRIADIFSGNLIAQQNEINILKLNYSKENSLDKIGSENSEFLPYQLEDKIIEFDTAYALKITKSIRKNESHYAPLLVWITGKIINTCVGSHQDNINLEKVGIWKNKVPLYLNFIKQSPLKKMLKLQKKVYELDLASKGLAGVTIDEFWQELDFMIIKLTSR